MEGPERHDDIWRKEASFGGSVYCVSLSAVMIKEMP